MELLGGTTAPAAMIDSTEWVAAGLRRCIFCTRHVKVYQKPDCARDFSIAIAGWFSSHLHRHGSSMQIDLCSCFWGSMWLSRCAGLRFLGPLYVLVAGSWAAGQHPRGCDCCEVRTAGENGRTNDARKFAKYAKSLAALCLTALTGRRDVHCIAIQRVIEVKHNSSLRRRSDATLRRRIAAGELYSIRHFAQRWR